MNFTLNMLEKLFYLLQWMYNKRYFHVGTKKVPHASENVPKYIVDINSIKVKKKKYDCRYTVSLIHNYVLEKGNPRLNLSSKSLYIFNKNVTSLSRKNHSKASAVQNMC